MFLQIAVSEYQPEEAEGGRTMTYREINQVANQLARVFIARAKISGHESSKVVLALNDSVKCIA